MATPVVVVRGGTVVAFTDGHRALEEGKEHDLDKDFPSGVRDWLLNSGTVVKTDSPAAKAIADAQQASKAPAKAK